jgi:hypothetical protein
VGFGLLNVSGSEVIKGIANFVLVSPNNQIALHFEQPIWCAFLQWIEICCLGSGFISGFKLK